MLGFIKRNTVSLRIYAIPLIALAILTVVVVMEEEANSRLLGLGGQTYAHQLEMRDNLARVSLAVERGRGLVTRTPAEIDLEKQQQYADGLSTSLDEIKQVVSMFSEQGNPNLVENAQRFSVSVTRFAEAAEEVFRYAAAFSQDDANAVVSGALAEADAEMSADLGALRVAIDKVAAAGLTALEREKQENRLFIEKVAISAGLALLLLSFLIARTVLGPLNRIARATGVMVDGNLGQEVPYSNRKSEIGAIASALETFRQTALQAQVAAQSNEELRDAIDRVAADVVAGDLSSRINRDFSDDRTSRVAGKVDELISVFDQSLRQTRDALSGLANGDLGRRVEGDFQGVFQQLQRDVNASFEKLSDLVIQLTEASERIRESSTSMSDASGALSSRAASQAASLEETAATMEEMSASVKSNADRSTGADEAAVKAREMVHECTASATALIDGMQRIEESTKRIKEITALVNEIAFQTNLLALNAGVEAARAGDSGRGFAVVAQEVRSLAQRASELSDEIGKLVTESSEHVEEGVQMANTTNDGLSQIVEVIESASSAIREISAASQEQSLGVQQIADTIGQLDSQTQRNNQLATESASTAKTLVDQSDALELLVNFFQNERYSSVDQDHASVFK